RAFAVALISVCWLILGVTNCVLLLFRTTPFNVSDFRIIVDAVGMIGLYLDPLHLVLIGAGFALIALLLTMLWRKSRKSARAWRRGISSVSAITLSLFLLTNIGTNSNALPEDFDSLSTAYDESGFVYGFAKTVLDRGISMPEDYTKEDITRLYDALMGEYDGDSAEPEADVIMIQLESVFDTGRLNGISISEDPMPFYSALKSDYSTGLLTVPSIGSGTANTEFEILTGMTTDCFGAGEYPYYTILGENRCESLAYIMRSLGYSANALHNNDGSFYDRDTVYEKLGFESYTSLEYMKDVDYNAIGWAEDEVLKRTILDTLDSTDGRDFVFAVTVASHGQYPDDIAPDGDIEVYGIDDESMADKYAYYVNELRKVDDFIRELISELENRGEPTVVVLYGDHIPALELSDDAFIYGNAHQTEYVIWDNFGLERFERDLYAYQLSSVVCELLSIRGGPVNTLNRLYLDGTVTDAAVYNELLTMVQYDLLYGDRYYFDYYRLDAPDGYHMSIYPITVGIARYVFGNDDTADSVYVHGSNFTPFSRVIIDGDEFDTEYISDSLLCVHDTELFDLGCEVSVGQFNENGVMLSQTGTVGLTIE
nr:sulfatase-like hydrolase/transferase [Clostridia bacterium]